MKNYLLVNRALAAEKNINYFNNLLSRVKEHSSPTVNRRSTDGQSQRQYTIGLMKYAAMITLLLTLACGQAWGANGDVLFLQDFNSVTAVNYGYSSGTTTQVHNYAVGGTTLSGLVESGNNKFTSLYSSIKKGDIAINSYTAGGGKIATGHFQAYGAGDNASYWRLVRSSNIAATAPTAIKFEMDLTAEYPGSSSLMDLCVMVGSGFQDTLTITYPTTAQTFTGFSFVCGSSNTAKHKVCKAGTTTTLENTGYLPNGTETHITWIINNTGDALTYKTPSGNDSTIATGKWVLFVGKQCAVNAQDRTASGSATYTGSSMQNIYIGNVQKKKNHVLIDNIKVTDLTPAAGCANYSFHTGTGDDATVKTTNTQTCFTQVGSSTEWQITNYTIPADTKYFVGKLGSFYNDGLGSKNSHSQVTDWATNMYIAPAMDPSDESNTPKLGNSATGAKGTLRIYDDSNWNNLQVAFIPDGYGITINGTGYAFSTTGTDHLYETTDLVTLPNVSSTTYQVGLKTATVGTYVPYGKSKSPDEAIGAMGVSILKDGKKIIYLDPNASFWGSATAKYSIWDVTNSKFNGFMTESDGLYVGEVDADCATINLVRLNTTTSDDDIANSANGYKAAWGKKWNQTANISLGSACMKYTITDWGESRKDSPYSSDVINHPATGDYGKFRIWNNTKSDNFYVHFVPYYVLTYDENGGSGTTAQTERNSESSTKTVSVASNGFTAPTGYTFKGWATDDSRADAGTVDYDPDDSYTLTANATLYAVWQAKEYTITLNGNGGSGHTSSVTATYNSSSLSSSITNPARDCYTFDGWYSGSGGTGTLIIDDNGDLQASTTYTDGSGNWTNDGAVTLYAKWSKTPTSLTVSRSGTEATPAGGSPIGTEYTLTCSASTGSISSYQWKQNTTGSKVGAVDAEGTGTTSANFNPVPSDAGNYWYYCVATDACGNEVETELSGCFTFTEPTYSVTYNANLTGTSGSTTGLSGKSDGFAFTTASNGFSRSGYKFKWWNTKSDGTGQDYYAGEKDTIAAADQTLYARWDTVASNQAFWSPLDTTSKVSGKAINITEGDMIITSGGATDAADINVDLTAGACEVSKHSNIKKHAKVLAIKDDNKYIDVHFSDGSPINKLWLGATTKSSSSQNIVVVYSATSDFSTAGGAAHEFKQVGSSSNLVTLPGNTQSTKAITDVSPSTTDTYYYARIYRKITTANSVFDNTANLGSGNTIRIYSIKAQKGASYYTGLSVTKDPSAGSASTPTISATSVEQGSDVTVTAGSAASGYVFLGWESENGTFANASNLSTTFTPTADNAVATAKYAAVKTITIKFLHNGNTAGWTVQGVTTYPADQTYSISVSGDWTVLTFSNVYAVSNIDLACTGHDWDHLNTSTKVTDDACYNWDGTERDCCLPLSAPTSLTCSEHTSSSLTFTWTKAANASGYTATLYSDEECESVVATEALSDVNTVTFSGLTPSATYYCKVQSKGDGSTYCVDGGTTAAQNGTTDAPTAPTFSPASGSTVSGSQTITITGHSGSTVYYAWATSAQDAAAIYNGGSGSHGTADAGTASVTVQSSKTLYAISRLSDVNSSVSSASYTVDDTAPTLSSSVPTNGATDVAVSGTIVLTFSEAIASVDGSKFSLTGATKGAVAKDGSDAKKVNIAYSGASNSATVTLTTAAGAVTDAVGNTSAALSNISFTTEAAGPVDCVIFSLEDEIGSAEITHNKNDKTIITTGISYFFESGEDRIKLTPKSGSKFKNGDAISISGKVNKADKNFGIKVWASDGSTSAGEFNVTGSTSDKGASCSGTLTLASDESYIYIGRYASTGTTIQVLEIEGECAASCSTPAAPTSPTNGATTTNTQAVSWTDESNSAWEVYVSTSSSTPSASQAPTAEPASTSYTFTDLTASTEYHWWVRSVCDETHKSAWVVGTSFTTSAADVTAPTLSSSTPEDDATGVGVSGNIVLTFSENVTINDASKFSLTGGAGTLNTASASASGADVTIPYTGLAYNTTYTLATAAEAVKDGSNNKNAALSDITFTTLSATGSCNELNYVWQTGSSKTPKGVSHTYADSDVAMIDNDEDATTHITISGTNYAQKDGSKGSLNLAKAKDNNFLLTAASGYVIDSVYFYGKLEDGACRMSTDGSAWTTTLGDGSTGEKVYAIGVGTPYFGLKNNDEDSPAGVWIRTMMVKVCPAGTTYTVSYNANGHGTAPDAETDIAPGSTISAPDEPTADCWTFNGWYKESACTSAWNFAEDEVNSNITLYAKWTSNKARVKGLDYGETDYTVTPAETGDAITVTPVSASGVTYKWYSNTSDDVTGWSEIPSAETASYSPSIASVGTTYYWAVLVHECGNDTTSSVRINVAASKTDPTIAWGNVKLGSVDATPTYGGGGYTLTGTINAGDDATPTLDASMISADGGIVITDKSVNDASKTFSLTFDVTAAFDTTQAEITNIHFSLPSNSTYNDTVFSTDLSFDKCSGGSYSTDVYVVGYTNATGTSASSSAANKALKVAKSWISTASPSFTDKTSADVFTISATNASYYWKQSNQTIINTTSGATMRMYKVGKNSCTIEWTNSSLSFSKVRIIGRNESDDPSTVTVSNGTEEKTFTFAGEKQGELQIQEVSMEFVHGSKKGVRIKGDGAKEISAIIELVPTGSDGAGTGTATTLQWKSGKAPSNISGWDGSATKIVKAQSDDDFTCVAEQTSATNSVGAITYASNNTEVATVNATTGEVDIVAGAAGGEATITATMARSGCFMRSTISYTISVAELECAIDPGTLSASATSKCKTADVTLTLSDYTTAGTTLQWYKSGTAEPLTDGSTYNIEGATMTTAEAGTYYVKVTLTEAECSLTSNNVTITNKGGAASVSKLVNQWYIKKGRVTPDIALWRLGEGSSYVANSAKADGVALTDQLGGCTVIARGSTIYLSGGDPTGISAVGDVSLTVQVQDECGNTATSDAITIHKQVATDKHELAFVTTGTDYKEKEFTEDAWTAGIKAANSTGLALYQVLKDTFKIQATNIYASDDEKKIREYYSQFDIICITDYPNTKTKGKNSKSYVDAMGSLIDIRPVLTMEAWVSGLDNWRNKGVVGTRTTPSKRQYNMYLQCKDHEIFEGVKIQQIGYGDDALFKVNMVDSTQSRYAQLDAVGKDSHATDTAALQGFTTGDMDLLALGLIDNGSGTNLQVGAERQNVMTARMMILGVNSYAMERLSDDGMRVIVNALQYLTKKRAEDISDCSTYFVGTEDENWNNPANWRSGTLPYSNQEARILQPVVVTDTRKIASVKIVADGTFQDQEAHGSLTIASTGALIVESKIQSSIGPDVLSGYPTETSHITIQTDESGQGALIFDNSNGETQATVDLYSKGCNDGSYKFQYFASPFMDISSWAFGDAYIYTHDESLDPEWTQLRYGEDVSAFQGLAITADGAARNYTIDGTLASTNSHTYNLTYTDGKAKKKGTNVIGNSWSAPIQITRIDDSDFDNPSNFEGVIYIYNAGRDVLVDGNVYASVGNSEPGQWQSIPVDLAKTEEWEHKRQIPAFQAFQMKVNAATEFTLDYNKHVRQEATIGVNNHNEKLHAPRRTMRAEEVKVLRLCVEDAQVGKSYIYLCEGAQFTEERDRGWEAQQTVGSGKYGKLYAIDQAQDYMMSIARESLEGTPVGFISGLSTEYTITFNETEGTYYLNDLETQQSTLIQEGESYSFTTTKGNHPNRFIISAIPFDKPGMATGVTDLDAEAPKVQKVIYNDKLFIIRGGKVFSADGQLVK